MKKTGVLLIGVLLLSIVLLGCSKTDSPNTTDVIPIGVKIVTLKNIQRNIELVGTLAAWREANLAAQTTARIENIYVEEGTRVNEGDLLFEMDDTQLAQARIQYQVAKDNFERLRPLYETGSISQSQFDQVKAAYETAEKTYKLLLKNTQFRAPFSGVITAKRYNPGEIFLLSPTGMGAPSIVTLMQLNPLKLVLNVSESNLVDVKVGQEVTITTDLFPGEVFKGTVNKINPAINPSTRTFQVEIKIPNPRERLKPGMFVRASINVGLVRGITIPRSAVVRQVGTSHYYGFIVRGHNAKRIDFEIGREFDEEVEIVRGLAQGDSLVVKGQSLLKDGQRIDVKEVID
ncbi:MAG: efflux RND transporter periplasmic adaptor subunit [Bacteroidetes bacterium]|nr:efflux RND transporter periplasmic adaptor subunit [Bacteroidota bacterium]